VVNETEELRRQVIERSKRTCNRGTCEFQGEIKRKFPRQRYSKIKEKFIFLADKTFINNK
jgi:hypothetical protein